MPHNQKQQRDFSRRGISFAVSILLAGIAFFFYQKYMPLKIYPLKPGVINSVKTHQNSSDLFMDLNADGKWERICGIRYKEFAAIELYTWENQYVDVIRVPGAWIDGVPEYVCRDIDGDGYGEIYTITMLGDSVVLNGYEPYGSERHFLKNLYLDSTPTLEGSHYIAISKFYLYDSNKDGIDEIIFTLMAGYTLTPRRIFRYDPVHRKLDKSPTGVPWLDQLILLILLVIAHASS